MLGLRVILFLFLILFGIVSGFATCAAWRFDEVAAGVRPLDPRNFPNLTAVTVGTGGAYENPGRRGPATAIANGRDVILVDAGRSVADALRAAELPVYQPEMILLTSLLPENTVGLDDLLFTSWLAERKTPLRLVGPPGTKALADHLRLAHAAGLQSMANGLGILGLGLMRRRRARCAATGQAVTDCPNRCSYLPAGCGQLRGRTS